MDLQEPTAVDLESMRRKFAQWTTEEKGRGPAAGEFFEGYIKYMHDCLVTQQIDDIKVERNVRITDNIGLTYEIDVLYEFMVAGLRHQVAVECKDTGRPIGRNEAMAFVAKLTHMSSTIGVFISRSGYQPSAAEYLDKFGVERLSGDQIPDFGRMVASNFIGVALPSKHAIGEPFWGAMEYVDGRATGSWHLITVDRPSDSSREEVAKCTVFPLFFSRRQARAFCRRQESGGGLVVRGIRQALLRVIVNISMEDGQRFGVVNPFDLVDEPGLRVSELTAEDLARDYIVDFKV